MADQQQQPQTDPAPMADLTDVFLQVANRYKLSHLGRVMTTDKKNGATNLVPDGNSLATWLHTIITKGPKGSEEEKNTYFAMKHLLGFADNLCARALTVLDTSQAELDTLKEERDAAYAEAEARGAEAIEANKAVSSLQTQLLTAQQQNQVEIIKALQAQAQNPQQLIATTTRKSLMKDPTRFTGEEKDASKRHDAFTNWKSKILLRWRQDSQDFPDEFTKILHASGLLDGRASQGIDSDLRKVLDSEDDDSNWPWKTGEEFLNSLDKKYNTVDVRGEARQKLHKLMQADDFAVYADFITEFLRLADRAGWDNEMKVYQVKHKVNGKIREAISVQATVPDDDDLDGWLTLLRNLATRKEQDAFDATLWKNQQPGGNGGNHGNQGNKNNNNNGNGNGNGNGQTVPIGEPMDLGKISLDERNRRMENNLCMYCGDPNHYRAQCPIAPLPRDNGGFRGRGGPRERRSGGRGGGRGGYQQQNSFPNQRHYHQEQFPQRGGFSSYPGTGYNQQPPTHLRQFDVPGTTYMPPAWDGFLSRPPPAPSPHVPAPTLPSTGRVDGEWDENGNFIPADQGNGKPSH